MSATITDYFNKASNMSGSYPAVATVTAARSTGGSTLSCDDLSSWATDTPVHFSTFKVNTDGTIDTSTQTDWKGIVNGNTITDMTRLAGAADSGNASGDRVELNPTIGWLDDLITGILVSHKQNGALKDNVVTESSIATGAVTNTKLGDGSVTSAKIGTGAISSYDKIGDDVIQARNIDTTTFSNLPVVTTTETLFVISSTNVAARYTRVGNVVFAFVNITCPSIAAHDGTSVSTGGVPDGYKPAGRAVMSGGAVSGGSSTGNFSIIIDPDNTRTIWNGFTTSNNTRLQLIGTWVTNDAWPSS